MGSCIRVHCPFISSAVLNWNSNRDKAEEPFMREFVRPLFAALGAACLAACLSVMLTGAALAQTKSAPAPQGAPMQPPPFKQVALTDKQIEGVIAAAKDLDAIPEKL